MQLVTSNASLASGKDRRPTLICVALVVGAAALYAGTSAWAEQYVRTYPLELDGWGTIALRLKAQGRSLMLLFQDPPLWKGPVVPFLFGLCYYIAPLDESILVFNVLAFAAAAGVTYVAFSLLGASRFAALLSILLWVFYLPLRRIFGYYFAEPTIALLSSLLLLAVVMTIRRQQSLYGFATGLLAGLLILARAPFVAVVGLLPLVFLIHCVEKRGRVVVLFLAGLLLVWLPWVARNYTVCGEFIPFTTDGGFVLFQGSYIPGDALEANQLRQIPEFVEIERGAQGKTPVEQYKYWRGLAKQQVAQDLVGQLKLCLRKAMRFWMYLPQHSWWPAWKTGLVALVCLPLAFYGALRGRRSLLVQLCVVWVGGLWAFHALIHAELRYNFPILPMMFLLTLVGVRQLVSRSLVARWLNWMRFRTTFHSDRNVSCPSVSSSTF